MNNDTPRTDAAAGSVITQYQPEYWSVRKDTIYSSIHAMKNGLEYAREHLSSRDALLGRSTKHNLILAEQMEQEIKQIEDALIMLRALPNEKLTHSEPEAGGGTQEK